MSSSVKPATQSKASNPSVPLANSAWSKGPPQTAAAATTSSRAQSPASNAPSNGPPGTHSRRPSTLGPSTGQGAVKPPVTVSRGISGPGHRSTNSISFGSVDPVSAPAPAPATPTTEKAKQPDPAPAAPSPQPSAPVQVPAVAAATPAQPPAPAPAKANGIKVVAPTPTQPAAKVTAPAASSTPPASTSTPKPKKAFNIHALFQTAGGTPTPPAAAAAPPAPAPATVPAPTQPPVVVPPPGPNNNPRGPYPGRDNVPFPRSPQITRPTLAGTQSGSGGPRPAGSPRMGGAPMPVPHPHHQQHPQHPQHMQPQWSQQAYYYQQGFDPYQQQHHYWQQQQHHPHAQHSPYGHIPPHMHNPPMQQSPRMPSAQPRPPSTPPVTTTSPHPPAQGHAPPPISTITTQLHNAPSTPTVSTPTTLNTAAAAFVPGQSIIRPRTAAVRISTPDGSAVLFENTVPPSPKVSIGMGQGSVPPPVLQKRQSVIVKMESAEERATRVAKEKEEKEKKEREEREKKEEKERLEREAKEKEDKEREEKERKEKEEKERVEREERERVEREVKAKEELERKEREEKERVEREERERVEREQAEAEAKVKAEEEAKLKAEAEAKAKEEAEAKAKAEEEAAAAAAELKAKEEAEAAAKVQAEAEEKAKADAEAKAKADAEVAAEARDTVSPVESPKPTSNGLLPSTIPERPSPLSISTTAGERPKRPVPGPLDLSSAQGNRSAAPPSALASARIIEDLSAVSYPEAIKTPNPDLNIAATPGKFRYDRDFLLQFMNVCKEKPDSLPPLDAIGLEPGDPGAGGYQAGGARQSGRRVNSMNMGTPTLQRQASMGAGLGLGNVLPSKSGFSMGNFQAAPSQIRDSQSRFDASTPGARGVGGMPFAGPGAAGRLGMSRSASQGGVGGAGGPRETKRTRSQRGNNRTDSIRGGSGFSTPSNQTMASFEPVAPLEQSENRWVAGSTSRTPQQIEDKALVDRKVKSLLNKLTMDKFDSISDQIIEWANKSEQEKDGTTLMQVIRLIFEKAKDEAGFSEMYARLCRKMMERVSPNVQDETIRSADGQPITGGLLFRKYLLNRCQEDFERGWSAKEAAAALAASKAGDDKAAEAAGQASGEAVLYSEEYYAAAKAKRQGLGLVRFIGELFKLQMLTERIMHECIKKLLSNVVNPEEEEIESLCKLLTTVGQSLDTQKAKTHMDIYFERMSEMARGSNINSRMQYMLQDVLELRLRHWQTRSAVPQPSTIAAVHEQAKRDEVASRNAIQRGGSRRGADRGGDHGQQVDGWNVAGGSTAARPPAKAGDLSNFGKISKPTGLSFGPTSVFSKANPKPRDASLSRANSSNMFAALNAAGGDGPPQPEAAAGRNAGSRKPSIDLGPGGSPAVESGSVRRKLVLAPRTKPTDAEAEDGTPEAAASPAPAALSEADVQKKVKEDIKEYLGVENVEEAIMALETLPTEHRHIFVDKLLGAAFDGGNKVVVLAEKLFAAIHKQQACSIEVIERGMLPTVEMADDISIDVPKTYEWLARLMSAAGIERTKAEEMAEKISVLGEPRVQPKDQLMQEFDKISA